MEWAEWEKSLIAHFQPVTPKTGKDHDYMCKCPAHDDKKASLSVTFTDKKVLLRCFAGCSVNHIATAAGLPMASLFFENGNTKAKIIAEYSYTDEQDRELFQCVRFFPKDFRQRHKGEDGKWQWTLHGVRLVPFHLSRVLAADTVYIVEGEKDVLAAEKLGLVATCNPMGAGKWKQDFSQYFKGKHIIIIPDNDAPGRKHAEDVAQKLSSAARSIKILSELPGVPEKGDLSDWIAAGHTVQELDGLPSKASDQSPCQKLPEWAFWTYDAQGFPRIEAHKFLQFLETARYCTFKKLTDLAIVKISETIPEVMEYQEKRGQVYPQIKEYVISLLLSQGFQDVADTLLMQGRFFSLDVLELLQPVPKPIAYRSIFSEVQTEISFDTPIQDEQKLIVYQRGTIESTLLSTDNYCSVTADTGVGKSLLSELIASEALSPGCESECPFNITVPDGKIFWFDGERSTADVVRSYKRIARRIGAFDSEDHKKLYLTEDCSRFHRLEIRAMKGIKDKIQFILEFIESFSEERISLLLIDGALDLVKNMNDEEQASALTNLLDHLSKKLNCGIIITVHASTNGKETDGTGMGHVGKGIGRGAASRTLIRQQENEDGRDIKCWTVDFPGGKVRSGPKIGISAYFAWDEMDEMPHFIAFSPPDKLSKVDQKKIEARKIIETIFERAAKPLLRHKELYPVFAMAKGCSEAQGKREITMALNEWGILEKIGSQYAIKANISKS